jgi:parvulin-like peptidyl-prolyl isomerase
MDSSPAGTPAASSTPDFGSTTPITRTNAANLQANGMEPFDLAKIVAQVGDQYILKGELIADANLLLMKDFARLEQLPEEERSQTRSALLASRDALVEQLLSQAIERKLTYLEFVRTLPIPPDKKKEEEQWRKIRKNVGEEFYKQLGEMAQKVRESGQEQYAALVRKDYQLFRIALVMKDMNIESPEDPRLELVLRENGTSIYSQQQAFMERLLGRTAIGRKLNLNPEITHDQILAYYREHIVEHQVPTRARWEQLTLLFSRFRTKEEAGEMIAKLGNQLVWGGTQFFSVAQKYSQEKNAEKGGYHDWTTLGDLRISKELSNAIFSIPLNELSEIIVDDEGLHIIRVLEREQAHVIPFMKAQVDIKENLRVETVNKSYNECVAKLREITPIWTEEKGMLPRATRTTRATDGKMRGTDETQMKHR